VPRRAMLAIPRPRVVAEVERKVHERDTTRVSC
jgi:hypothetical protein